MFFRKDEKGNEGAGQKRQVNQNQHFFIGMVLKKKDGETNKNQAQN
jgi:hypothetical protein